MADFVNFTCPEHGFVCSIGPQSRVQCKCGKEVAPEGMTLAEHHKRYFATLRQRRARKRDIRVA